MEEQTDKLIVIIGAGPSGLAATKYSVEMGLKPVVLQKQASVGGVWHAQTGRVWKNMKTNISKSNCQFVDFPHHQDTPVFPTNQMFYNYLMEYCKKFQLLQHIKLNCDVQQVSEVEEGKYRIIWKNGEQQQSIETRSLIISSGLFSQKSIPNFNGLDKFKGNVLHSRDYKQGSEFLNKNILVVGGSFTGIQLSADISIHATVYHSFRTPFFVLNHYVKVDEETSVPIDFIIYNRKVPEMQYAPYSKQQILARNKGLLKYCTEQQQFPQLRIQQEDLQKSIFMAISSTYLDTVRNKKVIPRKGQIKEFTQNTVIFQDGTQQQIDAVMLCTGYKPGLKFLSKEILQKIQYDEFMQRQPTVMYKAIAHPSLPRLFFVGISRGILIQLAEFQARFAVSVLSGNATLPSKEQMLQDMKIERMFKTLKPIPQSRFANYVKYGDQLAKYMNLKFDLETLKNQDPEKYKKYINLPVIQQPKSFSTDDIDVQIQNIEKAINFSTVRKAQQNA